MGRQDDKEEDRERRVKEALARARKQETGLLDAVEICLTVIALYQNDTPLKPLVEEAGQLRDQLLGRGKPS